MFPSKKSINFFGTRSKDSREQFAKYFDNVKAGFPAPAPTVEALRDRGLDIIDHVHEKSIKMAAVATAVDVAAAQAEYLKSCGPLARDTKGLGDTISSDEAKAHEERDRDRHDREHDRRGRPRVAPERGERRQARLEPLTLIGSPPAASGDPRRCRIHYRCC